MNVKANQVVQYITCYNPFTQFVCNGLQPGSTTTAKILYSNVKCVGVNVGFLSEES